MNSLFQLEIPKRHTHCAHQGERLLPGMEIYSLLVENSENLHLARHDFCVSCWNQTHAIEQSHVKGYWKSTIEQPKTVTHSSRIERALALLHTLQHSAHEAEIFVLCLFLSHARQITLRQEFRKESFSYHLYEILRKEEFLTVKVINLSQIQIENIQKSLAHHLTSYAT